MSLDVVKLGVLAFAGLGQTLFVLFYVTRPWYDSYLGKALFAKGLTLMILVDVAVVGVLYDWPYEDATMVALYALVALGIWGQFLAFLRNARGPKNSYHTDEEHHHGTEETTR